MLCNQEGGTYTQSNSFTIDKWFQIARHYTTILHNEGGCTVRKLASVAEISTTSAQKAIQAYHYGFGVPLPKKRGHGKKGNGSLTGMTIDHQMHLYELYISNPSRPLDGYSEELFKMYGKWFSKDVVRRWFMTAGPYKGSLRATSRFPSSKDSPHTIQALIDYTNFIKTLDNDYRLVFADEKPMKEVDIYGCVRRDPMTGQIPTHRMNVNSKNRYNILAAVNLKGGGLPSVHCKVLEECTNSQLFMEFVKYLLNCGALDRGDVFIVDNCTIHTQGDNTGIKEGLWNVHGIIMITLPPYHPELNPTEFVFNGLLQRLSAQRARYNAVNAADFLDAILIELASFDIIDVILFYRKCGYIV